MPDHFHRTFQRLFTRYPVLVLQVDIGRRVKGVNTFLRRVPERLPGAVDVFFLRPRKTARDRPFHLRADALDGLKIPRRADRESGLDDVHPEAGQLFCERNFFLNVHARARGLLPVAERSVEYFDACTHGILQTSLRSLLMSYSINSEMGKIRR